MEYLQNCNCISYQFLHFKLILDMFVVLYRELNCAVDKAIGTGHTTKY